MKMMIGRTLKAKRNPPIAGIPSFCADGVHWSPASQPKRNDEPLSAYPIALETLSENASSASFPLSQYSTRKAKSELKSEGPSDRPPGIARRFFERASAIPTTTAIPTRPIQRIRTSSGSKPRARASNSRPRQVSRLRMIRRYRERPMIPVHTTDRIGCVSAGQRGSPIAAARTARVAVNRPKQIAASRTSEAPIFAPQAAARRTAAGKDRENQRGQEKQEQHHAEPSRKQVGHVLGETVPDLSKAVVHANAAPDPRPGPRASGTRLASSAAPGSRRR